MTDSDRLTELKRSITTLVQEFEEKTKWRYKIISIDTVRTEQEDLDYPFGIEEVVDGVDLNIQV